MPFPADQFIQAGPVLPVYAFSENDLRLGAKSLALTLSAGVGSVALPDSALVVGVKPAVSATVRIGLEAPEADGTKTGNAALTDLKKGLPVDAGVWTWCNIGQGAGRTLYFKGGASDVIEVAVM